MGPIPGTMHRPDVSRKVGIKYTTPLSPLSFPFPSLPTPSLGDRWALVLSQICSLFFFTTAMSHFTSLIHFCSENTPDSYGRPTSRVSWSIKQVECGRMERRVPIKGLTTQPLRPVAVTRAPFGNVAPPPQDVRHIEPHGGPFNIQAAAWHQTAAGRPGVGHVNTPASV